jgi:hypothetical protein
VLVLNCMQKGRNWLAGCWHLLSFGHWQGRRKSLCSTRTPAYGQGYRECLGREAVAPWDGGQSQGYP